MWAALPERIAADQLMAEGGRLEGSLPLARLGRLVSLLSGPQPADSCVRAELRLVQDVQGHDWLRGRISAQFEMVCERCGEHYALPVAAEPVLRVVASEPEAAALAPDVEYVVAQGSLPVHELIEDELILALPLVGRHPAGTRCADRVRNGPLAQSGARDNPFAVLKNLKT